MIITVGNSRCTVDGTTDERVMLEKVMMVDTKRFNPRGGGNIIHRFFKTSDETFPTGLLSKVIAAPVFGPDGAMKIELVEARTREKVPKGIKNLPGIAYHEWQREAIKRMLASRMGLVNVATNGGKTIIMIGYVKTIENRPIRGIIITHSAEIHAQLYKEFKKYLGKKVGRLTSKVTDVQGRQFVIAMAMTLRNRIGDDPYVTKLFEEHKLLMADECVTGDSLIKTEKGQVKISDFPLTSPKYVLCFNESLARWERRRIVRWLPRERRKVLRIVAKGATLRCTPEHLLMTTLGWKQAKELRPGTLILSPVPVAAKSLLSDAIREADREGTSSATRHVVLGSTDRQEERLLSRSLHSVIAGVVRKSDLRGRSSRIGPRRRDGRTSYRVMVGRQGIVGRFRRRLLGCCTERYSAIRLYRGHTQLRIHELLCDTLTSNQSGLGTKHQDLLSSGSKSRLLRIGGGGRGRVLRLRCAIRALRRSSKLLVTQRACREIGSIESLRRDLPGGSWTTEVREEVESVFIRRDTSRLRTRLLQSFLPMRVSKQGLKRQIEATVLSGSASARRPRGSDDSGNSLLREWSTSFLQILRIEDVPGAGEPVFDLEVEGNHNFVANGILVHNCHHLTAKTWSDIFKESDAPLRFGFSGTIPDPKTFKGWQVMASGGRILIDVRNAELIEAGVSAQVKVTMFKWDWSKLFEGLYHECLSSFAAREGNLFRGDGRWRSTYLKMQFFREYQQRSFEKGIVHNEERNADIVKKIMERKQRQCLLITERIDHGNNLVKMFREAGHEAVFIHGEAADRYEALDAFRAGTLRTLISTQILDEGIDIAGIQTLVMAGVMKCERALLQRTGRGLRKKTKVPNELELLDYMDFGNKYLERYSGERKAIFIEEGFPVTVAG